MRQYEWLREQAAAAKPDKCIIWPHNTLGFGYGKVYVSADQPCRSTHSLACEIAHGPRPSPAHHAAHRCGQRLCFNPHHLYWATVRENADDVIRHGSLRGVRNPRAVLNDEKVAALRALYSSGTVTQREVAMRFGVSRSTVSLVVRGLLWKHVAA